MNIVEDISPLTDFKRDTTKFIDRLKKTKRPMVLTMNGKSELVVMDAASYQRFLDRERELDVQAIYEGLESLKPSKCRAMEDVLADIRKSKRAE